MMEKSATVMMMILMMLMMMMMLMTMMLIMLIILIMLTMLIASDYKYSPVNFLGLNICVLGSLIYTKVNFPSFLLA